VPRRITYRYDSLSRLTEASYEDGATVTYSYDQAGNLVSVATTGVGAPASPLPLVDDPAPRVEAWFYLVDGVERGPVPREDLERLFAAGLLSPDTFVWMAGMSEWRRAVDAGLEVGGASGAIPTGSSPAADLGASWYLSRGGGRYGPFTLQQLRQFIWDGQVVAGDLVWHPSLAHWMTIDEARARIPGLA